MSNQKKLNELIKSFQKDPKNADTAKKIGDLYFWDKAEIWDRDEALKFYKIAAELGDQSSKEILKSEDDKLQELQNNRDDFDFLENY